MCRYSRKAAYLLKEILTEFHPEEIHEIERQADTQRHEITDNKELKPSIIRMNTLEEKEDELFISSMRKLHVEEQDVRNIIAWREIYTYLVRYGSNSATVFQDDRYLKNAQMHVSMWQIS